ncbi:MAG TPA: ABC transporter permease [Anaerolineae bacterium]|nr:ABC transporter permease [Anaerolineae bacterium]
MSLRRTIAIVRKEVLHIARDPRNVFLVTVSPAFLLFLLAYIFSFDVGQFNLAVLDLDHTSLARRYLASLTSDPDLYLAYTVSSYEEIQPLLVGGDIDAALVIPPGFADTVHRGKTAQVQAIVDGTDPFVGSQAVSTLASRSGVYVADTGVFGSLENGKSVEIHTLAWYNAGLQSQISMVPALLAIVLIMPTMALALALTREKESGTLEGLLATPVSGPEYVVGKLLAYIVAGLVSAVLALLVAVLWFGVPFRGSLAVYLLLAAVYFLACMGATVVIANVVKSQQTAMFIVLIIFIVPSFFLAGLISPVSTESLASMLTSYALPSTHFVEISRSVFLKGLGLEQMLRPALILLGMGLGALAIGLLRFKKKVL